MTGRTPQQGFDPLRRRFLSAAAAAAGVTLAPGVTLYGVAAAGSAAARAPEDPATSSVRWGLLVDVDKCREGCDACVAACVEENGLRVHGRPETDAQKVSPLGRRAKYSKSSTKPRSRRPFT